MKARANRFFFVVRVLLITCIVVSQAPTQAAAISNTSNSTSPLLPNTGLTTPYAAISQHPPSVARIMPPPVSLGHSLNTSPNISTTASTATAPVLGDFSNAFLPTFVPNVGQWSRDVLFQSEYGPSSIIFGKREVGFAFVPPRVQLSGLQGINSGKRIRPLTVWQRYFGASSTATIQTTTTARETWSYYGSTKQYKQVPTCNGIIYRDFYAGIDLHYERDGALLKSTYYLDEGADPSQIRWTYQNASDITVDVQGNLIVSARFTDNNSLEPVTITERAPTAWQEINHVRQSVDVSFVVRNRQVQFSLGAYDSKYPLVIDPPLLVEATYYMGSTYIDDIREVSGTGIAVDNNNNVYITGRNSTRNENGLNESIDVYVKKLELQPDGTYIPNNAVIRAPNSEDDSMDIAIGKNGNVYIVGSSSPNDPNYLGTVSPATPNAYQTVYRSRQDAFIAQFNASLDLVYFTLIGGTGDDIVGGNGFG